MKIAVLHLSDIHIKTDNNSILEKQDFISNAFRNDILDCSNLFVLVTGDIAFSGKKEEYEIAEYFFKTLEKQIKEYHSTIQINFIFCAGNHDCDFTIEKEKRDYLIKSILNNKTNPPSPIIKDCVAVQKEYFNFISRFDSYTKLDEINSNELVNIYKYILDDKVISFNSYNLSWISTKNEIQANILFPLESINTKEIENTHSTITISMLHHPFHWLNHKDLRGFQSFLSETSSIILSGHEHTAVAKEIKDITNNDKVVHIEGGTLQDSYSQDESKFNLITISMETQDHTIYTYNWEENIYQKSTKTCSILINKTHSPFKFKDNYEKQLHELEMKIPHETKGNLTLDDIFIYQDVKVMTSNNKSTKETSSEKFLDMKHDTLKIIYGEDNSGKTTLLHKLQIELREKNVLSLLINGAEIKESDIKDLEKLILKTFKYQYKYDKSILTKFEQFDRKDMLIIIDDFHKINSELSLKLLYKLESHNFINITIMANSSLKFEATSDSDLAEYLENYSHFELLELGHILRDKFITKWIKLSNEAPTGSISNTRREKAERINKAIGLNIVPTYPLYILTLLIAMDNNNTSLEKSSSYGHYYHFMIMQYLNKDTPLQHTDINTIFAFLSELAFEIFESRNHKYTFEELQDFNKNYIEKADFEPSFNILDKLIKTEILRFNDNKYGFAHKYIYYYFVAEYLAQKLDEPHYTLIIENIIERLHNSELANILMFILHLSPKKLILEKLIKEAEKIFSEVSEFTFAPNELEKLNASIKEDTTHRLKIGSIEEARQIELRKEERKSNFKKRTFIEDKDDADYKSELTPLDFFTKLNLSYKLIEILGEIVKNYAGSTTVKADIRLDLIKNTYGLGLRSLKIIVNTFEKHHEHIVDELKDIIEKTHKGNYEIDKSVHQLVFNIASIISTDTIKKISKSLSIKELRKTYEKITNDNIDNRAYELINHAIKLNIPNGLDEDKIVEFHKKLRQERNFLTDYAIKNIVLSYLYMFETSINVKTSISKRLGIETDKSNAEKFKSIK